ncbi:MAG: 4Fe-4S binding protein [Chloroflexi bacterium]|nr:4Fe-4S binding protein [Chloroflexota bacterium]
MEANYGYSDGSGDYFIIVDTDKCNGCGDCVTACPERVFEVAPDDYGKKVALVKESVASKVSYVCPGYKPCSANVETTCHTACKMGAISHTW